MSGELQKMPDQMAVAPAPSVGQMLQAVIEKGVTAENVAAIEKLVGLYERMEDKRAEREFAQAFVELQSRMPKVQATQSVQNRDGTLRYKFAPLEEIARQIGPTLKECGFTFSFSESFDNGRLTERCTIQHISGHKRVNEYSVRVPNVPGANETQCDGAASSYAKRYCLLDALGIVVERQDDDARNLGGKISRELAEELARRVNEVGADRDRFLRFAGADSFFAIDAVKYDMLDQFLQQKERKGK